jgi:hypothetical protein
MAIVDCAVLDVIPAACFTEWIIEMQNKIAALEAELERLRALLKNYDAARYGAHASRLRSRLWNVESDLARLQGRTWP